jgi:hypothetical protein
MTLSPKDAELVLILMGKSDSSALRPGEHTAESALRIVQALKVHAKEGG